MGLLRTALVFGAGYAFGHPDGRRRLNDLGDQARQLTQRPEVVQMRERGWNAVSAKLKTPGTAGSSTESTDTATATGRRGWRPRPFPRRTDRSAAPEAPVGVGEPTSATTPTVVTETVTTPGDTTGTPPPVTPATTAAPGGTGGTAADSGTTTSRD